MNLPIALALTALFQVLGSQDIRRYPYGSNCVIEETGVVTPYYRCYGCRIEEAMGCLSDMRLNKSGNVAPSCVIGAIAQTYDPSHCCPSLSSQAGQLNLNYLGSAYPETLRCIQSVGCGSSAVYAGLLAECQGVCEGILDQNGNTICLAQFNGAAHLDASFLLTISIAAALSAYLLIS